MTENRFFYLLWTVLMLVAYHYNAFWYMWFLLLLTILLPALSLVLSIAPARRTRFTLEATSRVKRGQKAAFSVTDKSGSRLMPRYIVQLSEDDPSDPDSDDRWHVDCHYDEKHIIDVGTSHCRAVTCRVTDAYACDYLGLFRFRLPAAAKKTVYILPEGIAPEPMPSFDSIRNSSLRPKYGGGFSEIQELRGYRPGDAMRDVHWKLSAKTGDLIVREPQEPYAGLILITVDIFPPGDAMDCACGQVRWLSEWFAERGIPHEVRWLTDSGVDGAAVKSTAETEEMLCRILDSGTYRTECSIKDLDFPEAAWRCHISGRTVSQ